MKDGNPVDRDSAGGEAPMDPINILKGAGISFLLCITTLMPVFYFAGAFLGVARRRFRSVFLLAAALSFIVVYSVLRHNIHELAAVRADAFVGAYVGGWLAGLVFGVTQLKPAFLKVLRPD